MCGLDTLSVSGILLELPVMLRMHGYQLGAQFEELVKTLAGGCSCRKWVFESHLLRYLVSATSQVASLCVPSLCSVPVVRWKLNHNKQLLHTTLLQRHSASPPHTMA